MSKDIDMPEAKTGNKTAQAALYVGIVSFCLAIAPIVGQLFRSPLFIVTTAAALVLAILGMVFGFKGLKTTQKNKATAGLVLSIFAILVVVGIILLIGAIILFYPRI